MHIPVAIVIVGAIFAVIGVFTVGWLIKSVIDWNNEKAGGGCEP